VKIVEVFALSVEAMMVVLLFALMLVVGAGQSKTSDRLCTITGYDDTADLRRAILSFGTAFLHIVEVMMIVTGLVGPIFLALSMFPVGTKPLIAWGTSFQFKCITTT
jgi:hypothetical protein